MQPAVHRSALVFRSVLRNAQLGAAGGMQVAAAEAKATTGTAVAAMTQQQQAKKVPQNSKYDVFISHRGVDTKRTVAGLLYDRLVQLGMRPFLDSMSMGPGDRLLECIDAGVRQSAIGVAILSPRYCESVFCLHELAMLVESRKRLIPVFFDVKPSELKVGPLVDESLNLPPEKLQRFTKALEEAKYTVGLTFDSQKGNWADLVSTTADSVLRCMQLHNGDQR